MTNHHRDQATYLGADDLATLVHSNTDCRFEQEPDPQRDEVARNYLDFVRYV